VSVRERLEAQLTGQAFVVVEHGFADTAESVAIARGTPLSWGAKSLVFKLGKTARFGVFALSGDRAVNSRAIRKTLGVSRLRFASTDELLALTGLSPGCVPPFGRPVFEMALYLDETLARRKDIAFSLGEHTTSVVMTTVDFMAAARPEGVFSFSTEKPQP
jgi:prolyl-tRNA editing enzyme YbaK/EbsC (Cys-tRNA(Pro) deacylase)